MDQDKLRQTIKIFEMSIDLLEQKSLEGLSRLQDHNQLQIDEKPSDSKFITTINFAEVENSDTNIAESTKKMFQLLPQTLLLSFIIELTLKLLLIQSIGKPFRGHDINSLFKKLPINNKKAIIEDVKKLIGIGTTEFDEMLKTNNRVFEQWRYHFEPIDLSQVDLLFLKSFYLALREKVN